MPKTQHSMLPVRRAEHEDLAAAARLHEENFTEAWSEDFWRRQIAETGDAAPTSALLYVSPINADRLVRPLAGLLLARRVVDEAEILTVAVADTFRRQGVARRLLDRLIVDLCRDLPCRLFLEVSVANVAALALYTNYGFTEVGSRKDYYRAAGKASVDAKILALELRN
jgi:ribosomal-protein-alanine N-acetyltransferase